MMLHRISLCLCLQIRTRWSYWYVSWTQNGDASLLIVLTVCAVLHKVPERETAFHLCNSLLFIL